MQADMTFTCLFSEQTLQKPSNTILHLNKMNWNWELPFAFSPDTHLGCMPPLQEPFQQQKLDILKLKFL